MFLGNEVNELEELWFIDLLELLGLSAPNSCRDFFEVLLASPYDFLDVNYVWIGFSQHNELRLELPLPRQAFLDCSDEFVSEFSQVIFSAYLDIED